MGFMRAFVDTDVVISALLSQKGAAYYLLHRTEPKLVVSSISLLEIDRVSERLDIDKADLTYMVKHNLHVVKIGEELKAIEDKYKYFVTDINDAHIVAGAYIAKSRYLITYNLRHFMVDRIKNELGIIALTPALFLQFLRIN